MNQSTSYAYHMWPGLSEDLRRVCRKYGIRTVFNIISTLRQQLTKLRRSRMKNHFSRKLQNPLQLRPRIHRRDQEDSEDPSEGTPGSHQKRRDGKVRHSRAADSWTKHHRPIWDELSREFWSGGGFGPPDQIPQDNWSGRTNFTWGNWSGPGRFGPPV